MRNMWLRKKEHMEDAEAQQGEEGRSKRRNASGSGKHTVNRRYPNGGTPASQMQIHICQGYERQYTGN